MGSQYFCCEDGYTSVADHTIRELTLSVPTRAGKSFRGKGECQGGRRLLATQPDHAHLFFLGSWYNAGVVDGRSSAAAITAEGTVVKQPVLLEVLNPTNTTLVGG